MAAAGTASQLIEAMWPEEGLTRVPYRLFQDPQVYAAEQRGLFQGPLWNFLCLAVEVANPGDFCTTAVGDAPVVVTRDKDGDIYAFENRCAHRGSLLVLKERGEAKDFICVYHNWSYDLCGTLTGVAFPAGSAARAACRSTAKPDATAAQARVAELHGSRVRQLSDEDAATRATISAPEIPPRIERVMRAPVKPLGGYSQRLANNWKLYMENVKDTYHASLLHTFFTTFELNRLSQRAASSSSRRRPSCQLSAIDRRAPERRSTPQNSRCESEHRLERP